MSEQTPDEKLERSPRRLFDVREFFALLTIHFAAAFLFLTPGYIRPDSVGTFTYLRSLVFDHDLLFFNEWAFFGMIRGGVTMFKEVTALGTLANHWWIGSAVLSSPPYVVSHLIALGGGAAESENGFTGLYGLTLAFTAVAFATLTSLLALRTMRHIVGARRALHYFAWAVTLVGTAFFWYEFRLPLGTHMAGALALGALTYCVIRNEESDISAATIGFLVGFAISTRLQHLFIVPALAIWMFRSRKSFRSMAISAAFALVAYLPQFIAWWVIYGTPLGPVTAGVSTWTPFRRNGIDESLFSSYHGLLTWCPIVIVALAGWAMAWRKHPRIMEFFTLSFVGELFAAGVLDCCFWGGFSFGGRRLLDLAVMFAVGVAFFIARYPRLGATLSLLAVLWTTGVMSAVITGSLHLGRDVTPAQFVATVVHAPYTKLVPAIVTSSPLARSPGSALLAAAIAAFFATAIYFSSLQKRRFLISAVALTAIASVVAAIAFRPTRAKGEHDMRVLQLNVRAAQEAGALIDSRGLLRDEMEFLRARGRNVEAARSQRDIEAIDARLRALR